MNATVKKLEPETVLAQVELNVGDIKAVGVATKKKVTFAVVDESGTVIKSNNGQYEIYPTKRTAELAANWYNKQGN